MFGITATLNRRSSPPRGHARPVNRITQRTARQVTPAVSDAAPPAGASVSEPVSFYQTLGVSTQPDDLTVLNSRQLGHVVRYVQRHEALPPGDHFFVITDETVAGYKPNPHWIQQLLKPYCAGLDTRGNSKINGLCKDIDIESLTVDLASEKALREYFERKCQIEIEGHYPSDEPESEPNEPTPPRADPVITTAGPDPAGPAVTRSVSLPPLPPDFCYVDANSGEPLQELAPDYLTGSYYASPAVKDPQAPLYFSPPHAVPVHLSALRSVDYYGGTAFANSGQPILTNQHGPYTQQQLVYEPPVRYVEQAPAPFPRQQVPVTYPSVVPQQFYGTFQPAYPQAAFQAGPSEPPPLVPRNLAPAFNTPGQYTNKRVCFRPSPNA